MKYLIGEFNEKYNNHFTQNLKLTQHFHVILKMYTFLYSSNNDRLKLILIRL